MNWKDYPPTVMLCLLFLWLCTIGERNPPPKPFNQDAQVGAGEWKVEVQVPPCTSDKNIQVVFPHDLGGPISIECNNMPVGTR